MTDDICGADTTGDEPCKNPPGDNGRCWIPTHQPDADENTENPHGRDFTITEDDHDDILEAARIGMSKAGCARAAGVAPNQLNRYLESHDDFRQSFMRARHKGEQRLIEEPLFEHEDRPDMDGQHARFLLSTSFDYVKTEKKELEDVTEGSDGFGTTIVLDSEYTDDDE